MLWPISKSGAGSTTGNYFGEYTMSSGSLLVWLASLWLYAGAAVAAAFLLVGIDRVSENARGAYLFRPLLVPGILLLWPLVLWRWFKLERDGSQADVPHQFRPLRMSHAWVWSLLAVAVPAILIGALLVRQSPPDPDGAAVQLVAPVKP
jgi:hypothetical protein